MGPLTDRHVKTYIMCTRYTYSDLFLRHDNGLGFQLRLFLRLLQVGGDFSRALGRVALRLGLLDVWTNTASRLQQVLQLIIVITWFICRRRYKGTNYDPSSARWVGKDVTHRIWAQTQHSLFPDMQWTTPSVKFFDG